MRRFISIIICIALIMASAPGAFAAVTTTNAPSAPTVSICIDDDYVAYTASTGYPFIDSSNRTQVPLRATMEAYGCDVQWNGAKKIITVSYGTQQVSLQVGAYRMLVGNHYYKALDTTPVIIGNRTYLPIRAVLEAFGATVDYDGQTKTIDIKSPAYRLAYNTEGVKEIEYEWSDPYNSYFPEEWTYTAELDRSIYNYYTSIDRKTLSGYTVYAKDPLDDAVMTDLIEAFRDGAEDYTDDQLARLVISFVQSFDYVSDVSWTGSYDEYAKFPYETLYDHCGDCEDTAILLVTLLLELGYDSCLISLPGHMAVGIAGEKDIPGWYFEHGDTYYYYIETTAEGWDIGDMPDEYQYQNGELLFIN